MMDPLLSDIATAERTEHRWICIARIAAIVFGVAVWTSVLYMQWWPIIVAGLGLGLVVLRWAGWSARLTRLSEIYENEQQRRP